MDHMSSIKSAPANGASKMTDKFSADFDGIKGMLSQASDQVRGKVDEVRGKVEKNPIAALCAALGVGLVAGLLLRRR